MLTQHRTSAATAPGAVPASPWNLGSARSGARHGATSGWKSFEQRLFLLPFKPTLSQAIDEKDATVDVAALAKSWLHPALLLEQACRRSRKRTAAVLSSWCQHCTQVELDQTGL